METTPTSADNGDDKGHEVGAGIMRALARQSRSLLSLAARVDIGSLPHTMPVRQVAERVGTAIDIMHSLQQAKERVTSSRFRDVLAGIRHAVPPFVRNAVLGTALFALYEDVSLRFEGRRGQSTNAMVQKIEAMQHSHLSDHTRAQLSYAFTFTAGVGSGAVAGGVHGLMALMWDSVAARKIQPFIFGTTVHHTLSHATLFGVYEMSKRLVDDATSTSKNQLGGLVGVAACGALAGTLQELVSFYSASFETHGVRGGLHLVRGGIGPLPGLGALVRHVPAISIGFVAFEYGKDVVAAATSQ